MIQFMIVTYFLHLESPTASIHPLTLSTDLEEMVTFQCVAGGTQTTVTWGPQPLPSGVVQSGSDLVIAQASRDHAGQYVCTVSNSAGSVTSTATLTVNCESSRTVAVVVVVVY